MQPSKLNAECNFEYQIETGDNIQECYLHDVKWERINIFPLLVDHSIFVSYFDQIVTLNCGSPHDDNIWAQSSEEQNFYLNTVIYEKSSIPEQLDEPCSTGINIALPAPNKVCGFGFT